MKSIKDKFLTEIEASIKDRYNLEIRYRILQLCLMVVIAGCGFLTAAASQNATKSTWVSAPTSLLIFGLLSAVCAIINQVMTPSEKHTRHKSVKQALQLIRGEVQYKDMPVNVAESLRALAVINPELVLGKLQDSHPSSVKPDKSA